MTQEEKQLLLIDLSARLPYGVKFQVEDSNVYTLDAANYFALQVEDIAFKPYLRPMSSMTEEEKRSQPERTSSDGYMYPDEAGNYVDWLNANHFDYRGLIEEGLALEAPKGMYKEK